MAVLLMRLRIEAIQLLPSKQIRLPPTRNQNNEKPRHSMEDQTKLKTHSILALQHRTSQQILRQIRTCVS
eukprot:5285054-Amphidinium_carterae.1